MIKSKKFLFIIIILLTASYLTPLGISQNYTCAFQLLDEPNGSTYYGLNITVQQSLYEYYVEKSHRLNSNADFAKFVTPYALKPIADRLEEIYADEEDFVNGVLMIVHQIPYEATGPVKYPVETLVENKGDCDLFSYIAASIIKARGLDVVLLYYETQAHMNIGVSLSHVPNDVRGQAYYIMFNNVRYYMAEVTGDNWQVGWRVGECPDELRNAPAQVITLENCEQTAPGQVSASYKTLTCSTISLVISPAYLIQGGEVSLSGQLSPALPNETITIYVKVNNEPWALLATVKTRTGGYFAYIWNVEATGMCYIRACWSGNENYAGADSPIQIVTILSTFFVILLIAILILVCIGIVAFFISRKTQPEIMEPEPPEISYT